MTDASTSASRATTRPSTQIVRDAKQQIMRDELAAEVERFTALLAEHLPTATAVTATTPAVSCATRCASSSARFPVYRTYVQPGTADVGDGPRATSTTAATAGECPRPTSTASCSTSSASSSLGDIAGADELELALRFQQLTAPVMAKGVEDTAFYRYNRLVSLNEVGGDPSRFGAPSPSFHADNAAAPSAGRTRCSPRRPMTRSAAPTCGPGSTCCPSCPTRGPRPWQRWAERQRRGIGVGEWPRSQRRVPALPDARRRLADRRRRVWPRSWPRPRRRPRSTRRGPTRPRLRRRAARPSSRASSLTPRSSPISTGSSREHASSSAAAQLAGPDGPAAHLPGRARPLPGQRAVGSQPRRPRQPPPGRLRPAPAPARRGRAVGPEPRRCARRRRRPEAVVDRAALLGHRAARTRPLYDVGPTTSRSSLTGPRPTMWSPSPGGGLVVPRAPPRPGRWEATDGGCLPAGRGPTSSPDRALRRRRVARWPSCFGALPGRRAGAGRVTTDRFSVWAPDARRRRARPRRPARYAMEPRARAGGMRSSARPAAGSRYGFSLDGGPPGRTRDRPSQPEGVDGLSAVVDHDAFAWTDAGWRGPVAARRACSTSCTSAPSRRRAPSTAPSTTSTTSSSSASTPSS